MRRSARSPNPLASRSIVIILGILGILVVVIPITGGVLVGVRNLFTGLDEFPQASISTAADLVSEYCEISPEKAIEAYTAPNSFLFLVLTEMDPPSDWMTSPRGRKPEVGMVEEKDEEEWFASPFQSRRKSQEQQEEHATHLDVLIEVLARGAVEDAITFRNIGFPGEGWRQDLTGETATNDHKELFNSSTNLDSDDILEKISAIRPDLDDLTDLRSFLSDIAPEEGMDSFFSFLSRCELTLSSVPAPGALRFIRDLLKVLLQDVESNELPRSPFVTTYRQIDTWPSESLVFTFSNTAIGEVENPLQMSVWLPGDASGIRTAILWIQVLIGRTVFVLVLGMMAIWWAARPLRVLERSTRDAGLIIRTNDNVSGKLEDLAEELDPGSAGLWEQKTLLHEMSSLIREREEWVGVTLHDLKNDLKVIAVSLDELQEGAGFGNAAAPDSLKSIRKASGRIRSVLDNVTVYQRTLFGTPEAISKIDLGSVLDTIANDIDEMGGEIFCEETLLNVEGRSRALESALENLIWNAYHHGGGSIEIRLGLTDRDRKVVIRIDDDGPGIDDDEIDDLFKPYRQGKSRQRAAEAGFRGAGLGLTIAATVIADHGGEILIENREGEDESRAGLRVRVILPLSQEVGIPGDA